MRSATVAIILSCALVASAASIANSVRETPRLNSGEALLSSVMGDCLGADGAMHCMKGKVLTYLDSKLGLEAEQGRAFAPENVDKAIYERVGRLLATNQFSVQLPETVFGSTKITMNGRQGFDMEIPEETQHARGLLKKKLLLPVLLMMKLKMKMLMPIFVALIGLKATKALILSKIAITLVLGFMIVQLLKKTGLGLPMSMMPMMPTPAAPESPMPPMPAYGVPSTTSSYEPSSWEPSSGGPYSRVWDSQSVAYSSYYPSSSSSSSSVSGSSSASSPSSSSSASTGSSSITATSY